MLVYQRVNGYKWMIWGFPILVNIPGPWLQKLDWSIDGDHMSLKNIVWPPTGYLGTQSPVIYNTTLSWKITTCLSGTSFIDAGHDPSPC